MIGLFARYVVPLHRVLLVLSTVLIGIYASLVTTEPGCIAYWAACSGGGLGMYISDVFREIDSNALLLATKGHRQRGEVRDDVFRSNTPVLHMILAGASVALVATGIVFSS